MADADTITLPCGVVLKRGNSFPGYTDWHLPGMVDGSLVLHDCGSERWTAWWPGEKTRSGKRDDCLAFLDDRVLSLRRALVPPDAREKVAKALELHRGTEHLADAILAALFGPVTP